MQVIHAPNRGQTYAQSQRSQNKDAVVNGVSSILEGLIHNKTQQLVQRNQQQQTASGLQRLLKVPANEAYELAALDPKLLEHVVKSKLAEPSRQAYAQGLSQLFGQPQGEQQIHQYQQQQRPNQQIAEQFMPDYQMPGQQQQQMPDLGQLNEKQASELANLSLKKQKMTLEEEREKRRAEHEEKVFAHTMKKDALHETKEIRKDLFAKKRAANEALESIERMEELEDEGLPTAGWNEFVKNSGLDIAALNGAPAEEYNKIAANFIRNAKSVFGNRLTDTDLEYFLKTVPSLSNSPEGRKRINANLKRIARLDVAAVEEFNKIVKENGGIPPLDLDTQLDEALDKKREGVYKQFKKDLLKEVPASQNKWATGLSSVAGSALGVAGNAVSKAAGPALTGAVLGSRFGPYGAAAGGAVGALGSTIWDFLKK